MKEAIRRPDPIPVVETVFFPFVREYLVYSDGRRVPIKGGRKVKKDSDPAFDPAFLWRCIRTYAGYAIEQIEQGANVSPETALDIRRAKDAAADALFSLLQEESSND